MRALARVHAVCGHYKTYKYTVYTCGPLGGRHGVKLPRLTAQSHCSRNVSVQLIPWGAWKCVFSDMYNWWVELLTTKMVASVDLHLSGASRAWVWELTACQFSDGMFAGDLKHLSPEALLLKVWCQAEVIFDLQHQPHLDLGSDCSLYRE